MAASTGKDIVVRLDSIDQLFNAPDINPFSDEEVDVLGEPALLRAVRRLQAHRIRHWEGVKLILELPPNQITPDLEARTQEALSRYCAAKIEDNHLTIRLSRLRSLIGLGMVTVISIVVMGLAYLLFNWVEPRLENTILRKLQGVDIVIQPKSSPTEARSHGA